MRLGFLFAIFTFLPLSTIARSWHRGDECPRRIQTAVPGGGHGLWDLHYLDENESDEKREEMRERMARFGTMVSVHEALTFCPNITDLDLRVTLFGCSEWPDRWNFPFKIAGGDKYPPLKSLRLEGYRFDDKPWEEAEFRLEAEGMLPWYERLLSWVYDGRAWERAQGHMVPAAQRNKTNLDFWLDAMDWSQIESLALLSDYVDNSTSHLKIAPKLHSLKRLELSVGTGETFTVFVERLPNNTLTHLTRASRAVPPLIPLLERQGQSLEHLELRTPESLSSATPAYSNTELRRASQLAPKLTHLSINIRRNGTWPLETLELIASLPSIRSVDLFFDMASECRRQRPDTPAWTWERDNPGVCVHEDQFQTPFVDVGSSLELYKYMRAKNVGVALSNVTFRVGDWERAWDGPLAFPDWLNSRRQKVECTTDGKVDGEAWCMQSLPGRYWESERDTIW